jgi:hypothetical protein
LNKLNKKYNCKPLVTWICGADRLLQVKLQLFALFVNQRFQFVNSLDDALSQIDSVDYNAAVEEDWDNDKITVTKRHLANFMQLSESCYGMKKSQ